MQTKPFKKAILLQIIIDITKALLKRIARPDCRVGWCSKSSCTLYTLWLLRSIRLAQKLLMTLFIYLS
jgi:hypothetical protein